MSVLSIVIPAYNESNTIAQIVFKVQELSLAHDYTKEIIIVNDCSKDNTQEIVEELMTKHSNIKLLNNEHNLGKSQSVKRGILESTGDFVVVQDADLEYNPNDINFILDKVVYEQADVGYGNRFGKDNGVIYSKNFYGNLLLSFFSNMFTIRRIRVSIPDMEVCYKMIRGDVAREVAETIISTSNFGVEPEVTAKLSRYKLDGKNLKFIVLPINYYPRSYEEGKKMKAFRDGFKALREIIQFNLF